MRASSTVDSLTHPFGVLALAALLAATPAWAQPQSKQQERCITTMNKVGVRLAATQGKENLTCLDASLKGKLPVDLTANDCLTADTRGRISRLRIKLHTTQQKACSGTKPSFGYTNAIKIASSVPAESVALVGEVFDAPLDDALASGVADSVVAKCQFSMAKAYEKLSAARMKQFYLCKKEGLKQETITGAAMLESCIVADPKDRVAKARARVLDVVTSACQGVDLDVAFPGMCKSFKANAVDFANCISSRSDCHDCIAINEMDGLLHSCDLQDDGVVNSSCRSCGNGFTEGPEACDDAGVSATCDADCTLAVCGDGTLNPLAGEVCDDGNVLNGDGCDANCTPSACGNGVLAPNEECDDGNLDSGDGCTDLCTCEIGSTVTGCPDQQCPATMHLLVHAGVGDGCTTNADCPAGSCDPTLGRCGTRTGDDIGFTGIVHDVDTNDEISTSYRLSCGGPAPLCGQCLVRGIEPASGNCRCANDRTVMCDEPFLQDQDDCGGAQCECFDGPPEPASQGGFPVCLLWKHATDVTGTVNVDTGAMELQEDLRTLVYLGESALSPCPYCTGDTVAGDGVRDGVCVFGTRDGLACDTAALNRTFPAPGGDGHSLDCPSSEGRNISNEGVVLKARFATELVNLPSNVPCGLPGSSALCPCGVCASAPTIACSSDGDCDAWGPCGSVSQAFPVPNACMDGLCVDDGNGEGTCAVGPVQPFCDGVLRANGEPIISCSTNTDCDTVDCGTGGGCGTCSLATPRRCFLDTIWASGQADPLAPRLVATPCMPQVNAGLNQINGLPGAARLIRQTTVGYACPLGEEYTPGVGGCP